tara:strand:+ start:3101 stop:3304 length:204 start_codon:yes stop_codon:yes gene_type:complete
MNTEEYNECEQREEIACSRCFTMINKITAETRDPTKKELKSTANMFDSEHSEFVLNKYYNNDGRINS